jgi:hypothetical protein
VTGVRVKDGFMIRYLTQHFELWNGEVWKCKGCGAQMTGSAMTHPETCPQLAALTDPAGRQGRGRKQLASEDA